MLRTFNPARRAVLTTDASNVAVAAILTQQDDEGHQHPVAYESSELTLAEQNYPAHVLELLAVIHALRVFQQYLLGGGAPRPVRLRPADRQPGDHVAQDEIASEQDVRPLARRNRGLPPRRDPPAGVTQPDRPAIAPRIHGRQMPGPVDGRRRRGEPAGTFLAAGPRRPRASAARRGPCTVGGQPPGCCGDVRRHRPGGGRPPLRIAQGGGAHSSESPPMSYVPRTGAELPLGTGTTMAPSKLFWSHPTCTLGLTPTICKYCVIFKFGSSGRTPGQVLPWQPTARRRSPLPPGRQSCSAHSIL
jgi:hypothetical protein